MTVVKETSFPVTGCYSYNTYLKKKHMDYEYISKAAK